jgi:predicted nucleic acid-binding protein
VILVDTSVWVDHLRRGDNLLAELLNAGEVLAHPFVIGEIALGNLRQRKVVLEALSDLPQATVATDAEAIRFIDRHALAGRGIGYLDVHLLAAVRLTSGSALWTRDKRLHGVAEQLGLTMRGAGHTGSGLRNKSPL